MQGSESTVACRENKAAILQSSIDRMDSVTNRLQAILNRIRDGDIPTEGLNKLIHDIPPATIAHCLNDGPEHLNNTHAQMMGLLDQMEQELF